MKKIAKDKLLFGSISFKILVEICQIVCLLDTVNFLQETSEVLRKKLLMRF